MLPAAHPSLSHSYSVILCLTNRGLAAIRTTAAGQRLEALDLFARLGIVGGVAEVDVAVQARVRVVLLFGEWVRGVQRAFQWSARPSLLRATP